MAAFRRILNLLNRKKVDREIAEELQAHIDLRIESNIASGMTPEAARRDALLRFGNPTATRERVAASDANLNLDRLWFDVRYAFRQLIKSPGFTITAVLTLAIGIGANTAIFSSMDAVVLRPLAVPAMDRVVTIAEKGQREIAGYEQVALANYEDWTRQSKSFEEIAVLTGSDMSLTGAGEAAHVRVATNSASFFDVLRVQPILGRVFTASECQPGRDAAAVLNYGFWQRRFAGDPNVLGRQIQLDQRNYTIVGVLPKSMQYPSEVDAYIPFAPTAQQLANRTSHDYLVIGRLRDEVELKQAQSEMQIITDRLAKAYPATNMGWSVRVEPLLDGINGDLTPVYYKLIMGATLFVLLIVCANVSNLQFARGIDRRSEIAMRTALGATRMRILRQLLTENILLGIFGAAGGLVIGAIYLRVTVITMPERVARYMAGWSNISLNGRAFAFSISIALAAGLVSGILPAIDALRVNLSDQLKAGSRSTTVSRRTRRLRSFFACSQIALAVALVIGAALMSKGMLWMMHLTDTYEPKKMLTFTVTLPPARYDSPLKKSAFYGQSLDKLRALPGVTHAEITTTLPDTDFGWLRDVEIENRPTIPGKFQTALHLPVSTGYFDTLRVAITSGRGFSASDSQSSLPVAIVSQRFVDQYFPGQSPLGHRVRMGSEDKGPWVTIVGVAAEVNYSLWDPTQHPAVYLDAAQIPPDSATYMLTTQGNALALAAPAHAALAAIDPTLPLDTVETYQQFMNDSLVGLMYSAGMIGLDALIALLLAAIGIFGVMANMVGEQTREIGVRLAMGARREDVLGMILRRASWLTGAGLATGLVLAFVLARLAANLLRGVRPDDPIVFTAFTIAIAAIAVGSSWIPARNASRVDPIRALRSE